MIYLGMSPWHGMWKNRHQLMSRFARSMPVLYVEPWMTLRDWRRGRVSMRDVFSAMRGHGVRRETDRLYVYPTAPHLPVSGSRKLGPFTLALWLRSVRRAARRCGVSRPILWVSLPAHAAAIGTFGESLSIYHVVDEYSGYTGLDEAGFERLNAREQALLDDVDLTVTVSPELVTAKAGPGRRIELVENAVDVRAYQDAVERASPPSDLAEIPRPRLGYSGLIGRRLDLSLLRTLAETHRDWSIVLIGKVDTRQCEADLTALRACRNVFFLGQKPAAAVPDYVAGLDVGLLPYTLDAETIHISPLKMYEYLAAGKPIVSTDIPAARRKQNVVTIAEDRRAFIDACARALADVSHEAVARRLEEASLNTWDGRVRQLTGVLRDHLSAGGR